MKKAINIVWQHSIIVLILFSMITMTACTVDEVLSSIDAALQTAQGLSAAVGAVSPVDAASLTLLTGIGITGIEAIQKAYDTYQKNKTASTLQSVVAAAQAVQTNLPQELAALHISSVNAVTKATAWVNLMTDCAQAIVTELTSASSGNRQATVYTLTPESIQSRWASQVCNGDVACGALVKVHHKHLPFRF